MGFPLLRKLAVHYIAPHYPLKPTSLFISPTLKCSSRCVHCTVWAEKGREKRELNPAEWRKILSDPFWSAVHTFWLSGGEPTMRPDLHEIAETVIEALPRLESITIATNALDPEAIRNTLDKIMPLVQKRGVYAHLHLSLDGPQEIHDRIRGVEGAFSKLEHSVGIARSLKEEGRPVGWSFNCVIQKDNVDVLDQTVKLARELGSTITFNVADTSSGFYRSRGGKTLEDEDVKKALEFIGKLLADSDPYHRRHYETVRAVLLGKPRPYRCETLEATIYLDPDASIYPCPRAYLDVDVRVTEISPAKSWKTIFKQRARIRRELCPTCSLGCSFGEGLSFKDLLGLKIKP